MFSPPAVMMSSLMRPVMCMKPLCVPFRQKKKKGFAVDADTKTASSPAEGDTETVHQSTSSFQRAQHFRIKTQQKRNKRFNLRYAWQSAHQVQQYISKHTGRRDDRFRPGIHFVGPNRFTRGTASEERFGSGTWSDKYETCRTQPYPTW